MDLFSLAVGFVVGAFTSAAGQYLGTKYTDIRKSKEASDAKRLQWIEVEKRFPAIISEMKEDAKRTDARSVREFFVTSSRSMVNRKGSYFAYHTDIHSDLSAAVRYLEELGYVEDISSGNTPLYRMKEHFVDLLRNS